MLLSWIEALQLKPSSMINKSRTLWQKQQQHKERLWNWTQIKLCNKGAEQCNRQKEMHLDLLRRCREWDTGFFILYPTKPFFCLVLYATELSLFCCMLQNQIVVCCMLQYVTKPDFCVLYAAVCYKTWFLYAVCCSMLQNLIVLCCMLQYVTKPDFCMLYAAVCYKTWFLYAVCCSMLQNLIVFCCMLQSPFLSMLFVVLQSQTTALWWSRHTCRCRACSLHPSCDGTARM